MSVSSVNNQIAAVLQPPTPTTAKIQSKPTETPVSFNNPELQNTSGKNLNETVNSKLGIDAGRANKILLARTEGNLPDTGDKYGYNSITINGKAVSIKEIVGKATNNGNNAVLGPQNVNINGVKLYLDYHGTQPKRISFQESNGNKFSGVIVQKNDQYVIVPDKAIPQLGVGKQTTAPWRELGIPDWRQKQLQSTANEYINNTIPNRPGGAGQARRTQINSTDTNIAAGNGTGKLPVLNYSDVGKIYAAIAKDQRMTDSEKFEVARMVAEGYGKRAGGLGTLNNSLENRKYQLSSQFARPENADSGVHDTFPRGGRPKHETDHGTHTVNGANYSDFRHAREIQGLLNANPNASDEKILELYKAKYTKAETVIGGMVNTGDVTSSVNSARAMLAGLRQSQASGGKSGFAAFAVQWIRGSVSDNEGSKIIRDFKLNDEFKK